jgi:dihydropteroate synthase
MASRRAVKNLLSMKLGTCVLKFDEPKVMGIVNNTPDSFSGDGLGGDVELAVSQGIGMFEAGAAVVDIGGESTRPGAASVSADIEIMRTVPVIERLSKLHPGRLSIDTMKPEVAESALYAGASMVNDVSGLRDKRMLKVVAEHGASAVIMHMQGEPRTMQDHPQYKDVVHEILEFLEDRIADAERAGIGSNRIMVDPGIGFGKTLEHNLEILGRLREFKALGKPVLVGVSRKAFIGKLTGMPVDSRLEGSIAAAVLAVIEGADMVRVHDVRETVQALRVTSAVRSRIPARSR